MNTTRELHASQPRSHFIDLATGAILRLRDAAGTRIAVWSGIVWITQEGDGRDIVLPAGGYFLLDRPGLTIVQMLRAGEIRVDVADTQPSSRATPVQLMRARGREALCVAQTGAIAGC